MLKQKLFTYVGKKYKGCYYSPNHLCYYFVSEIRHINRAKTFDSSRTKNEIFNITEHGANKCITVQWAHCSGILSNATQRPDFGNIVLVPLLRPSNHKIWWKIHFIGDVSCSGSFEKLSVFFANFYKRKITLWRVHTIS